jgi:hypothetical protein
MFKFARKLEYFAGIVKFANVGICFTTLIDASIYAVLKLGVSDCVALIVTSPRPNMCIVLLFVIVAMLVSELVYIKSPSLFVVGGVIAKEPTKIDFVPIAKPDSCVVFLLTTNVVVMVDEA